jgi:transposase
MLRYAGLDVHKRVVEACVLDAAGQLLRRERFELTPDNLTAFARAHLGPQAHVALEATTNTWAVVRLLTPHVAEVVVSNPLATKAIAQAKVKTDKVDALVLAQLLRCDYLPRVWQPDEATQELRRLSARRSSLVADRTGVKNRLHAVLAQRLLRPPVDELFGKRGRAWLAGVDIDAEGRLLLDSDLRLLAQIDEEIAALDGVLAAKAYATEQVKLLLTLPGIDVTAAQTVLAAWGDVGRFRDADHAASYLGLSPSTRQSAEHCYHGPITKRGNGHARWVLVQAAQHLDKHPGPLGVFFRRLARKKNRNVAVVAAARKLATIAWHMLCGHQPYRYAPPVATQAKLARLRIRVTGHRRRSGPRQQAPGAAPGAGGTRIVKALAQVYQEEALPAPAPPPPGEARTVSQTGTAGYVASLATARRVARPASPPRGRAAAAAAGRAGEASC